jgi:dnd system-associated protein 4
VARRVRRNRIHEGLYKSLTIVENDDYSFELYKDVFMFAACIGVMIGKREPFEETAETIDLSVFKESTDIPIIKAIALRETNDVDILVDSDENWDARLKIVEEYANAGEVELERLMKMPGNTLNSIIHLIWQQSKTKPAFEETPLSSIVVDF